MKRASVHMIAWFRSKSKNQPNTSEQISELCGTFLSLVLMDDAVGMRRVLESVDPRVQVQLCNSRHLSTCPPLFMSRSKECLATLLEFGADIHCTDLETGNALLHVLGGASDGTDEFERLVQCLEFCCKCRMKVLNISNKQGETILDRAFQRSLQTCDPSAFLAICDAVDPQQMSEWFAKNSDWYCKLSERLQISEFYNAA